MINEKNIIQKSTILLDELKSSKLTMQELKCIEVYLSKINSHRPEQRAVTFERDDILRIFGDISVIYLKRCLNDIINLKVSDLAENGDRLSDTNINLFDMTRLEYSSDTQQICRFTLSCSASAMRYVFNLEELRYLRYKLRNVIHLKSKYSYQLFLYLVNQKCKYKNHPEFIDNGIIISVDDLAEQLNAPYTAYREIHNHIIKPCVKEINESTSIKLSYTPIKKGGITFKILFDIIDWGELDNISTDLEQIATDIVEPAPVIINTDIETILDLYPNFTVEDVKSIYNRILKLQPDKGRYGTARVDYFKQIYDDVKMLESHGNKIKSYAAYINKILDERIKDGDAE